MRKLVEFEIEGEYSVLVDVEIDGPAGTVEIGRGSPIERAADSFESALSRMRPMVGKIVASLQDLESRPTAVEIEFGVKLRADCNLVLAKAAGEGHIKVGLTWQQPQ